MIQGEIHTFPLPDLMQWLETTLRTGQLSLIRDADRVEIFYASGEIATAVSTNPDAKNIGERVATALNWRVGRFNFNEGELPASAAATNQHLATGKLLLDIFSQSEPRENRECEFDFCEPSDVNKDPRVFALADALRMGVAGHLLKEDFQVFPMPHLAARVLEMSSKEDVSLRDLGDLILTDQAVAAQILRFANSAASRSQRKIDTLPIAVQRLGSDEVIRIVLALSLQYRPLNRDMFAAERANLWSRSATAAFLARSLASQLRLDHNIGFLCGLLMDFGMNLLYSILQSALDKTAGANLPPAHLISEIVQDFHSRVGRTIGEKWQLPEAVIESMANHHCFERATSSREYVAVSILADSLATFALKGPREDLEETLQTIKPAQLAAHPAAQAINLSQDGATKVFANLPHNLDQALELLSY
jgi:HD-like signal output (HDOD) protein